MVERHKSLDLARARAATRALRHRGPDGIGEYSFAQSYYTPDGPVTVRGFAGHTRLSILDPQPRSSQPFRRGQRTLAYNGEIYNFRALRAGLADGTQRFETDGDTEVLLELLTRHGIQGLNQANGMWAFCLLDKAPGN